MARRNKKPKPVIIAPEAKADIEVVLFYLKSAWSYKAVNRFLERLENFTVSFHFSRGCFPITINEKHSQVRYHKTPADLLPQ